MFNFIEDNLIVSLALVCSLVALWLNYRTSRRQKLAKNPKFSFRRGNGQDAIILTNQGASTAFDVLVETKKESYVKWINQSNEVWGISDGMGGMVGGGAPWTTNCDGETRTIEIQDSKTIIIAEDTPINEVLIVRYRNYMGKVINQKRLLSRIYWE